jgi:hypothetical protein
MRITDELFLPEIENIKPGILSSHPQYAPPILIDRENGVAVEAIRLAFIVLKPVGETLCSTVKVTETLAGRYPQSILPVSQKVTISHAYGTGAKWVFREALCPAIIFDKPDDGGIG